MTLICVSRISKKIERVERIRRSGERERERERSGKKMWKIYGKR